MILVLLRGIKTLNIGNSHNFYTPTVNGSLILNATYPGEQMLSLTYRRFMTRLNRNSCETSLDAAHVYYFNIILVLIYILTLVRVHLKYSSLT